VPPVEGALQDSVTLRVLLGPVAERPLGAAGTVIGVIEFEAAEAGPAPRELVAVTLKV
jgi:hypothetical protein